MTKRKNLTIYSTLIFLILIFMALFSLQKNNVNSAKAQEPVKKSLITVSNPSYTHLAGYQADIQGQHLIHTDIILTYLFDETTFEIFGIMIKLEHFEIWDNYSYTYSFDSTIQLIFEDYGESIYISNINNHPYFYMDYDLLQYQDSKYFIPTFYAEWGDDDEQYESSFAATSDNGAFTSEYSFYGEYVAIPNSIEENLFSLMYPLIDDTYDQGYNTGYDKGYNEGNISGYNEGYTAGQINAYSPSWMESLFSSLDKIFQVEIFPNFKLWYLIGAPLMVALIVAVLKFLR